MAEKKPTLEYGRRTVRDDFETRRHAIDRALVLVLLIVLLGTFILSAVLIFRGY
jgi:hypothetical protein